MSLFELEIYATSHVGRIRRNNEDNYLLLNLSNSKFWVKPTDLDEIVIQSQYFQVDDQGIILAVSDGCSGALGGDISSLITVESIKRTLTGEVPGFENSFNDDELIKKLYDATLYANRQVHQEARTNPQYQGMGATITAVSITPETVDFLQVGDSRGYLVRKGKISQITKDQSLVNQLIDAGAIAPEEAETHYMKNVILQALGAQNDVTPSVVRLIPQTDDILLLCSDGLSNKLTAEDLTRIILNNINNLEYASKILIQEANKQGGEDNITVILVRLLCGNLTTPINERISAKRLG
jgi:PPM family protein phosphatase